MSDIKRDERGRFAKGHSGNPGGRPVNQSKYLKKIDTSMRLKDWAEIIKKAIEQAKRGDHKAREWLSNYLVGKPIQGINLEQDGILEITISYEDQDKITGPSCGSAIDQE